MSTNVTTSEVGASSNSSEARPILRTLRRSKTVHIAELANNDGKHINEVSFDGEALSGRSTSPSVQPTSSCQALRHAVSALTRIDDFNLEELGDGFFANVYKATHKVSGEEMVMKVNKDSANRASALREVQLMNKLSHPNVLRFLGVCVHEGQLHALTEYINGGTLEFLLSVKEEELPWTLRIKLALDIAKGMHYLHCEGVFHRDLTSKNILISKKENKNYTAIIADFGLATKIPDQSATEPLPPVGCPWWMAPEVIHATFYDQRADIFSFGIILLEITTRLDADPESMPRTQKFGVDYVKLCDMVDYCPLDFLQFAFKCCQILPEKRPLTDEVMEILEKIYKNLKEESSRKTGFHKRSFSEDNIIQTSEMNKSARNVDEVFVTAQIIAQVMREDDPLYCPASANPFANMGRLKDGRKVLESHQHRRFSSSSSSGGIGTGNERWHSFSTCDALEDYASQSLPSSPLMLRRAAEKLHQGALHGSQAIADSPAGYDIGLSLSTEGPLKRSTKGVPDSDGVILESICDDSGDAETRRERFSAGRTRSLGSLDLRQTPLRQHISVTNENTCPGRRVMYKGGGNNADWSGFCNRLSSGIRESSLENILEPSSCLDGITSSCLSCSGDNIKECDTDGHYDGDLNGTSASYFSVDENQSRNYAGFIQKNKDAHNEFSIEKTCKNVTLNKYLDIEIEPDAVDGRSVSGSTDAVSIDGRSVSGSSLSSYLSCSETGDDIKTGLSPLLSPHMPPTPPVVNLFSCTEYFKDEKQLTHLKNIVEVTDHKNVLINQLSPQMYEKVDCSLLLADPTITNVDASNGSVVKSCSDCKGVPLVARESGSYKKDHFGNGC